MIKYAKIARYLFIFCLIIAQSLFIPQMYETLFDKGISSPRVNYSPVTKTFLITEYYTEGVKRHDESGKTLNKREFERLTPLLNYRQLVFRNTMPDSINGIKLLQNSIRVNNIFFQIKPRNVFAYSIPLYPSIESNSGELGLEMPNDVFRIKDSVEFILCSTNEVLTEKSNIFTSEFRKQNFSFPAKGIYGNPTTRKPFDEGYFIVDSKGALFHFKRIKNKPYVAKVRLPEDVEIQYISVKESPLKEFYGLIITKQSKLFLISYDNYKLIELPSEGYNCKDTKIVFRGNLFYREINFYKDNSLISYVTDRDYNIVDSLQLEWETNEDNLIGLTKKALFPFKLSFTDSHNSYIDFYLDVFGFQAMIVNLIWVIFAIVLFETKFKRNKLIKAIDLIIILFTGIFGFIAVFLIRDEN